MADWSNTQPTRQDTWLISVKIAHPVNGNMIDYGTWDKMSGGVKQANAVTYRPGGMKPPISLGGVPTVTNVVVSRLVKVGRDWTVAGQLLDSVGVSSMSISRVPLAFDGSNIDGFDPVVYQGVLDRVTFPDIDSEGNAAALVELEMVVQGYPTQ